jgi:hypothetical protein
VSAFLKQLNEYKEAFKAQAEWSDMISAHDLAKTTGYKLQSVKDVLKDNGLRPCGKLGGMPYYRKSEVIELMKKSIPTP